MINPPIRQLSEPGDPQYTSRVVNVTFPIWIPTWARFMALDPAGCVCAFAERPVAGEHCWEAPDTDDRKLLVAEATYWWVDRCSHEPAHDGWDSMCWEVNL